MKPKIFLDCGFFRGNALKIYIDHGLVDTSWTIYVFEPNPEIDIPDEFMGLKLNIIRKAIWIHEGNIPLYFHSFRTDAATIQDTAVQNNDKSVEVETIDFSKFVAELPDALIICSMDIEGAEFKVLEKMLAEQTIDKIILLDVEFHDRLMADKVIEDTENLVNELIKWTAIKLKGWLRNG